MSILAPTVALLAENNNRVVIDPHARLTVFTVDAVALVTLHDVPRVLLFSKELPEPLEMTTAFFMDPESRDNNMIPVVAAAGEVLYSMRHRGIAWESHDELFSFLVAQSSHEFTLLEYSPVDAVYPQYHNNAEEAFDRVETFIDTTGFPQPARMLLTLRWEGRESRNHSEKPTKLKYGNVMIWSATSGNIFWATRGKDGVVRALEIAGCVADYSAMLAWVRQYRKDQWVIRGMFAMPYYMQKMSPKEEPVAKTPIGQKTVHEALEHLLNTDTDFLDVVSISLLGSAAKKHFPLHGTNEHYKNMLSSAIDEYMLILDGVGAKKRAEIKQGIINQFMNTVTQK